MTCWLARSWTRWLSGAVRHRLPSPLVSVESGGLADFFSVKGKLDVYPLLPQEAPVAAAVLTGLLAFLLG